MQCVQFLKSSKRFKFYALKESDSWRGLREGSVPTPPISPSQTGRGNVQGSLSDQRRRVASTRRRTALLPLSASSRLVSRSFCLSLSLMSWVLISMIYGYFSVCCCFSCRRTQNLHAVLADKRRDTKSETIRKPLKNIMEKTKNKTVKQAVVTAATPTYTQAAKPCE